jgi:hypothetical protein
MMMVNEAPVEPELLAVERDLDPRERYVALRGGGYGVMWMPADLVIPPGYTIALVADPAGGGDVITLVRMQ